MGRKTHKGCPAGDCHGYELVANIDLASYGADYDSGAGWQPIGWQPIGNIFSPFTAIFDGNNFTIGNLTINRPSETYVGLFSGTSTSAEFKNMQLVQVNVTGDRYVGGLGGDGPDVIITNSSVTGTVNGKRDTGGLLGKGRGATITASYAIGTVNGSRDNIGGLLGDGQGATIIASYAVVNVNGDEYVGGLLGEGRFATIIASYAVANVSGDDHVGGLVGQGISVNITASYAAANVSGDEYVGGLLGDGGFVNITTSYAVGTVSGRISVGGLIGDGQDAIVTAAYWDSEVSGISNGAYGTPQLTTALQLPAAATGIYEDWAGKCFNDATMDVWDFGNTTQYPALNCPPGGADIQPRTQKEAILHTGF